VVASAAVTAILCGAMDEQAAVTVLGHVNVLMETTPDQDRHALSVLARAADTRDDMRSRLSELLTLLPGLTKALTQLSERLADLGRTERARSAARRAAKIVSE
jgi:hypothetical protein